MVEAVDVFHVVVEAAVGEAVEAEVEVHVVGMMIQPCPTILSMVWIFETRPKTSVALNGKLWAGMVRLMLLASATEGEEEAPEEAAAAAGVVNSRRLPSLPTILTRILGVVTARDEVPKMELVSEEEGIDSFVMPLWLEIQLEISFVDYFRLDNDHCMG